MAERFAINDKNLDAAMETVYGLRDAVDHLWRAIDAIEKNDDGNFCDPSLAEAYRKNADLFSQMAEAIENRVNKSNLTVTRS